MLILTVFYLLSALYYCVNWFKIFKKATHLSPQEVSYSWQVLIVATIFWPIVVPLSYLEKRRKSQQLLDRTYNVIAVAK